LKTDNHNPDAKLALRRFVLNELSAPSLDVLDACQGSGLLWSRLRQEYPVSSYLGLDVKRRRGGIVLKSERYLARPGWTHNVIDIDTYGAPWTQWFAMLHTLEPERTVAVFLTIGNTKTGVRPLSVDEKRALGLQDLQHLPIMLSGRLCSIAVDACLTSTYGHSILSAWEAPNDRLTARYIGLIIKGRNQTNEMDLSAGRTGKRICRMGL
jgi:hypothetical protein